MRPPRKEKALLTPFFALLLLAVLGVSFAVIENARTACCRLYFGEALAASSESAFARYDTLLLERYGLLFYPDGTEGLARDVSRYAALYASPEEGAAYEPDMRSLIRFSGVGAQVLSAETALDGAGKVFEKEAVRAAGVQAAGSLAEKVLEDTDLMKSAGAFLDRMKKLQKEAEKLTGLQKRYEQVREAARTLTALREAAEDGADAYRQLKEKLEAYQTELKKTGEVRKVVEDLLKETGLPARFQKILEDQAKKLLSCAAGEETAARLSGIISLLGQIPGASEEEKEELKRQLFEAGADLFADGLSAVSPEAAEAAGKGKGFLEAVRDLRRKGPLILVTDGDLPERVICGAGLPSAAARREERPEQALTDTLLFQVYLSFTFPCYSSESRLCDLEYMLGSHASDVENLRDAAGKLLLLREAVNLAYLCTDAEKNAKIHEIASAVCGAAGIGLLEPAAALLLAGGWAFCESVSDVRALLKGKSVPFWKDPSTWRVSLSGLLSGSFFGEDRAPGAAAGMTYPEYLTAFLLLRDPVEKRLRCMDVIQTELSEEEDFSFARCVSGARVRLTGRMPFLLMPERGGILLDIQRDADYRLFQYR